MTKENACTYFLKSAELRADGVLRIRTTGVTEEEIWDGREDISPNNPDYSFWIWLRRKLRWRIFGPAGINEAAVEKFREEYKRKCA